jgi:hypothetical protein
MRDAEPLQVAQAPQIQGFGGSDDAPAPSVGVI